MKLTKAFAPVTLTLESGLEYCYLFTALTEIVEMLPTVDDEVFHYCVDLHDTMQNTGWANRYSLTVAATETELGNWCAFVRYVCNGEFFSEKLDRFFDTLRNKTEAL